VSDLTGVFSPAARAAIIELGHGRCIGCGRPDVTCQHRRARGMGGTSDVTIGHPANGVPLCGDGVRGCHGWTESRPHDATLLGWRLLPGESALEAPFFDRVYGWRRWHEEELAVDKFSPPRAPFVSAVYVDESELDRLGGRLEVSARMLRERAIPSPAVLAAKPHR
jgi:hypothetical protein